MTAIEWVGWYMEEGANIAAKYGMPRPRLVLETGRFIFDGIVSASNQELASRSRCQSELHWLHIMHNNPYQLEAYLKGQKNRF